MKIVITLVGLIIIFWLIWCFSSKRYTIPCPTWLAWMVERDNPFTKVNRAETIINHLGLKPTMTVLDVGCGPGRVAIPIAEKLKEGGHVVAMDIQQGMLDKTKNKALAKNLNNISYLHAALGDNKLEKNRFDRVILVTVLGEIPDREAALKELFNTLKPGGILSVTEVIFDPHFQTKKTILKLATPIGFRQKAFYGNAIAYTIHLQKLHE